MIRCRIWVRSGSSFEVATSSTTSSFTGEHSGFNSLGVLGYHEGNKLIDFYPYAADSTDAAKYDDWEQTALRSTENGGVWIDTVSGLKLTAAAFDSSSQTITVTVTFGQPAECSKRGAKAYPSQFLGYWVWHVRMSDDSRASKVLSKRHFARLSRRRLVDHEWQLRKQLFHDFLL